MAKLYCLDWSKAFDFISPDALMGALLRFGIADEMVTMIANIYTGRKFNVCEAGYVSQQHDQHFGISQGCPLSPFLFSILMTVLLHDARAKMVEKGYHFDEQGAYEAFYADDTLLIHSSAGLLQEYMYQIEQCGQHYGLCLNFPKVEILAIRNEFSI